MNNKKHLKIKFFKKISSGNYKKWICRFLYFDKIKMLNYGMLISSNHLKIIIIHKSNV